MPGDRASPRRQSEPWRLPGRVLCGGAAGATADGRACGTAGQTPLSDGSPATPDEGVRQPLSRHAASLGVPEGSPKYVGSYAVLRDFLRECCEGLPGPLGAARHQQLLGAVEDLSGRCSHRVNTGQAFFRGCDRDFASVLPGFGISFEEDPACAQCGNVFMPDARFCRKCGAARHRGDNESMDSWATSSFVRVSSPEPTSRRRLPLEALDDSGLQGGIRSRGTSQASCSPPRYRGGGGGAPSEDSDLATLRSIDFDKRSRGDIDLDVALLSVAFKSPFGLLERYNIEESVLRCWMGASARQYNANPYHDWRHAVDTVQFAYVALTEGQFCRYFSYHDILALLIACVGHDVGHMGTNNAFLVKTSHSLAMTYNDISPLENMHAHRVFQTFRLPGMNVLESIESDAATTLRSKIIEAILATDMSHHFELVEKLSARVLRSSDQPLATEFETDMKMREASRVDRRMLLQCCVHVFDLGHTCRPWRVHRHMGDGRKQGRLRRRWRVSCPRQVAREHLRLQCSVPRWRPA
ncbi:unnamed protein product [Prorocentrum cordatum]|uniref:Phosphodiesterase n=1 Tax=Prorocentrum cordatum TaxID=2364126 RepID=A0ABN9P948_9DINO|nr:unnamed protein product [Polarella glacialis]